LKKKHRIIIIVFAVVATIGIIAARILSESSGNEAAGGGSRDRVIAVEAQSPAFRPMTETREFTGAVKASHNFVVSARVGGRLLSINKRIGDRVRANEIVARLDDIEFQNSLEEARAQVNEIGAQLAHTEAELRRSQDLLDKGIVSRAEFGAITAQVEAQRSRRELLSATLRQRETNLQHTIIRAPRDGFVAQRHVDGGTLLATGAPIITVVDIDTVFVELAVTERDYRSISIGKKATVTSTAVPNETFEGSVYRVAPFFQAASRTAAVEVALRNDRHLLMPGMSARINIVLESDPNAQTIPSSALVNNGTAIFVVDGDRAKLLPVETGIYDGRFVQIISPANIDGKVITLGQHLLRDGSRVNVTNQETQENRGERGGERGNRERGSRGN